MAARDDREEGRARGIDQRFNHWTAVRNGLMNAHAELFAQLPAIVQMLPDEIDQMKLFELIQIIPSPTRAALKSGDFADYRIADPRIMRVTCATTASSLSAGRTGKDIGDLPRNSQCDVAVQRQFWARAVQIQRDYVPERPGPNALTL